MAVTVRALAAELRISDGTADPPEPHLSILTRLLGVADAMVDQIAPDAPDAIKDEARVRFAGYLFDQPSAARGDFYSNGWRNSGAASLVARWVERRASLQAAAAATGQPAGAVDENQVREIIEEWAAEQPIYHFYSRYSIADPAISTDTAIPAGGYEIELIPEQTAAGGIAPGQDFVSDWLGTLDVDLKYASGNNKRVTFALHFVHTIRVDGTPLTFDAVRTATYRINSAGIFTLPLNVFNSRSRVPLGSYTLQDGTQITITEADLADDLTIKATLEITSQDNNATIEELSIHNGEAYFSQLAAAGAVGPGPKGQRGDKGPPGDAGAVVAGAALLGQISTVQTSWTVIPSAWDTSVPAPIDSAIPLALYLWYENEQISGRVTFADSNSVDLDAQEHAGNTGGHKINLPATDDNSSLQLWIGIFNDQFLYRTVVGGNASLDDIEVLLFQQAAKGPTGDKGPPGDPATLPAATASTRGGVLAVTNSIIDADTSTGVFGWMISHVKRAARAAVRGLPTGGISGQIPQIASNGTDVEWTDKPAGGADLSDEKPQAPGTAAAGDGTKASRDDHVHPAGTGFNSDAIDHRLDALEGKTADLAAGAEPGAFATVTDVAAQGGLSASRSTRPTLQQAQQISGYAATRNPSADAGIYVVRLPIGADKRAYQAHVSPGELSGLQEYDLPAGSWHRLGADESYQYFYFPYPYRISEVALQVAANADHIGTSAYHGHVLDAQLLDRVQGLARLTADLQHGNLPGGWSAATDTAVAGVALADDATLTKARAATYALTVSGAGDLLIRVRRSDDPSQFRVRYSTSQGQLAYRHLHELQRLGTSIEDPATHDYYFGGQITLAHESVTVEVTGTAAHAGTSRFGGILTGAVEDGLIDLDALADAVAKRLLPALGDAGAVLQVNSGKTAAEWIEISAGGAGLFEGAAINIPNTQTGFKASSIAFSKAGDDGLDLLLVAGTDFSATDVVPVNAIVRAGFLPTVTADAMTGGAHLFAETNDEAFIGLIEGDTAGKGHLAVRRPSGKTGVEHYSFFRLPITRA